MKETYQKPVEIIKDKIKNKNLILFGEMHGTKEIPKLLSQFFSEIAKKEDFNLCLEIPKEFQKNLESFFKLKNNDKKNSLEYFKLIKNVENINKKYNRDIRIFCVDANSNTFIKNKDDAQNIREKIIAKNILRIIGNKKTFVILGNIHASKKPVSFGKIKIIPSGYILYNKLKDKVFSINLFPKKMIFPNSFNKGFDYTFKIKNITPCSFFKNNNSF